MQVILKNQYKYFLRILIRGNLILKKGFNSVLVPSNLIILAPHPDDEILGIGGGILQILQRGGKIHLVYLTDGEGSGVWPDQAEIKRQRITLSEQVCEKLGLVPSNITRLHLPDGEVPLFGQRGFVEVVESLKTLINILKPDAIFATHYLDFWPYDHVACAEIAQEAVKQSIIKPQLWYYWVWAWYNLRFRQLLNLHYKNMLRVDIRDQHTRKKELINLYLRSLTPDGKPWSGVLPKVLLSAFNFPFEIIEKI